MKGRRGRIGRLIVILCFIGMSFTPAARAAMAMEPREGLLWEEGFQSIELDDEAWEGWRAPAQALISDGERARFANVGDKGWATLMHTVAFNRGYPYLQIKVEGWGGEGYTQLIFSNASGGGRGFGGPVGRGLAGIFTFDVFNSQRFERNEGHFALRIDIGGVGTYVEMDWIRMVSEPQDAVLLKLIEDKNGDGAINIGDKLSLKVNLNQPAEGVRVSLRKNHLLMPVTLTGEPHLELQREDSTGKIWGYEFVVSEAATAMKEEGGLLIKAEIKGGEIEATFSQTAWPVSIEERVYADTPFNNNVHFFIYNQEGVPFEFTVINRLKKSVERVGFARYMMVRLYDPQERRIISQELTPGGFGRHTFSVPEGEKGVYNLILTGPQFDAPDLVGIEFSPSLDYGVMGRTRLRISGDILRQAYVYIPRNVQKASFKLLEGEELRVYDEKGNLLGKAGKGNNLLEIEPAVREVVWRLNFQGGDVFHLDHAGFPGILCFNPETARAIRGSAIYLDDGITVQHRFQAEMWRIMKNLRPEDLQVEIKPLNKAELLQAGRRGALSLGYRGPLSIAPLFFDQQNIDPDCHWFGSVGRKIWEPKVGKGIRWDQHFVGSSTQRGLAGAFAWAYSSEMPGNPYQGERALLYRAMIAAFRYYLTMTEAEEVSYEPGRIMLNPNWQHFHFCYTHEGPLVLYLVKESLPEEARRAWEGAVVRHGEHLAYWYRWQTNQWAKIPVGHYYNYRITGKERFDSLWRRHLDYIIDDIYGPHLGQSPAGYFRENHRIDGGYNSMSVFILGSLYLHTRDSRLRDSLERSWELRAHLTLPEPDGSLFSPTHFATRTPFTLSGPIWPDAALLSGYFDRASDHLLRVAEVHMPIPWGVYSQESLEGVIEHWSTRNLPWEAMVGCRPGSGFFIGAYLAKLADKEMPRNRVPLPVEEGRSFLRNFNDEFIIVNRPTYHLIIYTSPRTGEFWARRVMQGGGLSAFWTPEFGSAVLGVSDGPWFNHAITGYLEDGNVFSSSFTNQSFTLSEDEMEMTVKGAIRGTPLSYIRHYRFDDEALRITLTLTADRDFLSREIFEVIPYLEKDNLQVTALNGRGQWVPLSAEVSLKSSAFRLDNGVAGVKFRFSSPLEMQLSARLSEGPVSAGHVRLSLPRQWREGEEFQFFYDLIPF